jgi:hypothetical protein
MSQAAFESMLKLIDYRLAGIVLTDEQAMELIRFIVRRNRIRCEPGTPVILDKSDE